MSTKSKQETKQTQNQSFNQANTFGQITPEETPDIAAMRGFEFGVDPGIATAYGSAKNRVANTFNSSIGGNYSPQIRDAMLRSQYRDLAQQQAAAHSQAYSDTQGSRFGQKVATASMTQPKIVQTGASGTGTGTSSGTTTMSQPLLPDIIGGAAAGASA